MSNAQATSLKQALRFADIGQAELIRLMRENREALACSESHINRFYNGLRPGPQYRAAINRALATRNVEIKWD